MDFKQQKAIYLQIAERLCDDILTGVYPEAERLPSVREYAAQMEVNVNTLVRSYDWLQQNEVIYQRRGLGYFVAEGARKVISVMRRQEFFHEQLPTLFRTMHTLGITMEDVQHEWKVAEN